MELLSLISILGFALTWERWQKTSASSAILHSVSAVLCVLFAGSLLNLLFPTAMLLLASGLFCGGLEAWRRYHDETFCPVAVGMLALFGGVYWLVHSGSSLLYYDEYSHWGVFIKEMLAGDQLWGADTNSLHPRYLPGTSLWQYYFAMFSERPEGAAYLAQFTLLMTPLMVLWEEISWRRMLWHAGITLLVIFVAFNFGHGFTSLYVDHILGAWFVGVLLNVLYEYQGRTFRQLLTFLLPLSVLVLTKTTGIFFAAAGAGIISLLLLNGHVLGAKVPPLMLRWQRAVVFTIATAVLCLSIIFAWTSNRDASGVVAGSEVGSPTAVVAGIAQQQSVLNSAQQSELTRRFFRILLHQQISKDEVSARYNAFSYPAMDAYTDNFRLTTVSLMAFSLISIFLLWNAVVDRNIRFNWVLTASCVWITAVLYIAALYFGTLYVTTSEYGLLWSSYIRYAHSMLLAVVLICFSGFLPLFADDRLQPVKISETVTVKCSAVIFTVLIAVLLVFEPPYLAALYKKQPPHDFRAQTESVTDRVREITGESRLWVFFPNEVSNGALGQMLQYQLTPGRVYVEESGEALLNDPLMMRERLKGWDYIWLADRHEEFRIASETMLGQEVGNGLFRIESMNDEIVFVAVAEAL